MKKRWEAPKPEPGQTYDDWLEGLADSLADWVNEIAGPGTPDRQAWQDDPGFCAGCVPDIRTGEPFCTGDVECVGRGNPE